MLGKIIKYDMKAMNRFLIIIHAFLLIYAFFIRILITGSLTANNVHNLGNTYFLILGLTVSFGIILLTCVAFATSIIIAVHFYKSTYSDEGYLTHTLPVKKGTLLIAKVIAGTIWCIIDIIGLFAAIYIAAWVPYVKDSLSGNKALLMEIFRFGIPSWSLWINCLLHLFHDSRNSCKCYIILRLHLSGTDIYRSSRLWRCCHVLYRYICRKH